jgi:hypothetical protein
LKGERAAHYKTGREITQYGYVKILVSGYHPRKHKGKVFEHIIVMEKKIGRFLKPEERVHHINGNKQDNRPDLL